jgi:hypothetical protein
LQLADEWELLGGMTADVAIALGDPADYQPKPAQLNVLWPPVPPPPTECDPWDLVLVPDKPATEALAAATPTRVAALDLDSHADPAEPLLELIAEATARDAIPSRIAHRSQSSVSPA